ncbi:hypothetical protein ATANTOWER_005124 [Ataeniobius toweri]|uniref:Secreted protein n=1 Tax=Ataeniobius toweri TaxID=208326 RepID=A0ABU7A9Q8_9TELE|nr:hypothetical protein [Ataeniobius toweri]
MNLLWNLCFQFVLTGTAKIKQIREVFLSLSRGALAQELCFKTFFDSHFEKNDMFCRLNVRLTCKASNACCMMSVPVYSEQGTEKSKNKLCLNCKGNSMTTICF